MKTGVLLFGLTGVVVVGLIGFAVWKGNAPSAYDQFASCLTEKETKMFGAWWCPHCQAQKKLFGNAFDSIAYVECSDANKNMVQACVNEGIQSYPTWKFADGSMLSGEQTLETLSEKTSCALPEQGNAE